MVELANTIWASGPAGSPTDPDKALIRAWGTYLEGLATLAFTSSLVYSTRAALYANLVPAANVPALVIGDPTSGYDGLYQKVGATTTGSWTRLGDVPGRQYIKATDAGAGTANAIVATTDIPLPSADRAAIITLNIYEANTSSPVTVAFNGGPTLTIKTLTGNDVAAAGLPAGAVVAGYVSGATFRLLSDQASAAIQAAAEAAAALAEAAADDALEAYTNLVAASGTGATVLYQNTPSAAATTVTLSESVANVRQINVYRNGVLQRKDGGDYTVVGTTLTVGDAFTGGEAVYVEKPGTFPVAAVEGGFLATNAEGLAGTATNKLMTPAVAKWARWRDPGTELNFVGLFGAVAGEGEDNDQAFEDVFDFYENVGTGIYFTDFSTYGIGSVHSLAAMPKLKIPTGEFVYRGAQFTPTSANFRGFHIEGEGQYATLVAIENPDVELFQFGATGDALKLAFSATDIAFLGGSIFANRRDGTAVPQGITRFERCRFLNQTRFVIASTWDDDPFLQVRSCHFWNDLPDTIGLTIPRIAASVDVQGNTFEGFAYPIKVLGGSGGFQANWNINNNYFWRLDADGLQNKADVWIVPGGSSDFTFGQGIRFTDNRFSNENLADASGNARPRFLIADEDTGTGDDEFEHPHSTSVSTGIVRGLIIEGNTVNSIGDPETKPNNAPFVLSYTPKVSNLNIHGNYSTAWCHWFGFGSGVGAPGLELQTTIHIGPNFNLGYGPEWPNFNNTSVPAGAMIGLTHPNSRGSEVGAVGQVYTPSVPSAQDKGYVAMDSIAGSAFTIVGSVTETDTQADVDGGTTASIYDFDSTNGTSTHVARVLTTGSIGAGHVIHIEFYAAKAASNPMTKFKVEVTVAYASGSTAVYPEVFPLDSTTAKLRRMKIPIVGALTAVTFRVLPTFATLGSADRIVLDKFRAYAAGQWIDW